MQLTERQQSELEYHRLHAAEHLSRLQAPIDWDIVCRPHLRWWNAYWQMYDYLAKLDLHAKKVLVVGCGFGDDALRLAKLGGDVHAFDLSPESLAIAKALAAREGLLVDYQEMPAEQLRYASDFFDCVVARDILHHVDIRPTMSEIRRVAKDGAILVVNEIYSHSFTDRVRRSRLVEQWLYPAMQRFIYGGGKPYITPDERKLNEKDLQAVKAPVPIWEMEKYFNFFVTRVVPDRFDTLAKIDRLLLSLFKAAGPLLAGRVLLAGRISK